MTRNPFTAPSAVLQAGPPAPEAAFSSGARHIFLQWEKLRVVYLVILGGVCLLFLGPLGFAAPGVARTVVEGAIAANLLYFAGPAVESYVAWLGFRPPWLRWTLFIGGTLLSMLLAVVALVGVTFPHPD